MASVIDYDTINSLDAVTTPFANRPYYLGTNRRLQQQAKELAAEEQYAPISQDRLAMLSPNINITPFAAPPDAGISYHDILNLQQRANAYNTETNAYKKQIAQNVIDYASGKMNVIPNYVQQQYPTNNATTAPDNQISPNSDNNLVQQVQNQQTKNTTDPNINNSTLFIGDSIAHGFKKSARGTGTTQVGANPAKVLSFIKANNGNLQGKTVYLSSGISNNISDMDNVRQQIALLKQAGANIKLIGVANNFKGDTSLGSKLNSELANIAHENDINFIGGFNASRRDRLRVHPDYNVSYLGITPTKPKINYNGKHK